MDTLRIAGRPVPKILQVFRHADFRILWFGAFLSFTGSWVQSVAQGYFVYRLTGDEGKLALVSFAGSFPVFLFGFIAGSLADSLNKRVAMTITQGLMAVGTLYLAAATYWHFVSYGQVLFVAALLGLVSCVEMPTRQSIVSRVVPTEELAAAVPVNAMTFIIGPAIGAFLLSHFDVEGCYLVNGISFLALIWAALAIRSDMTSRVREPQPIKDLIFEGALYTLREPRLRVLLILETVVAVFGIFYIPLIPAYVHQVLGVDDAASKALIGQAYTAIGVGGLTGLCLIASLAYSRNKGLIILMAMTVIGVSLALLSTTRSVWVAWPLMALIGGATIIQFNTTNALFQVLSPERLRGRVLSMHIWALNGLSPFGILALGYLARGTRDTRIGPLTGGITLALVVGGLLVLVGCLYGFMQRRVLADLEPA
jgi:MFS family permease